MYFAFAEAGRLNKLNLISCIFKLRRNDLIDDVHGLGNGLPMVVKNINHLEKAVSRE